MKQSFWATLLALVCGAALGLLYSWVLAPVRYVDTTPDSLRADFKDQMRSSIAAAYAATGNIERARARLALLGDQNSVEALSAQAQQMLASGDSMGSVEQVAALAAELQSQPQPEKVTAIPATSAQPEAPQQATATAPAPNLTETAFPEQTIEPPAIASSPTPRPTRTATSAPGAPFELVAQDTLCEEGLQEGLMQVIVNDRRRRPVSGAEIIVAWDGGEEHFFTGFKPELGNGYADFIMQPGVLYSVRVAEGGPPISDVTPPSCTTSDGNSTTGAVKLTFQQH